MDRVQNLTQAYSQAPWRKQLQIIGLFLLFLVFVALIAGIYLNVTARAATIGRDIQSMQSDMTDQEQVNADLQSQLALITSSSQMEKRARAVGFETVEIDQSEYVMVPGYVNRQAIILAPAPSPIVSGAPVIPPEYTESLFDWLHRQLLSSSFPFIEVLR